MATYLLTYLLKGKEEYLYSAFYSQVMLLATFLKFMLRIMTACVIFYITNILSPRENYFGYLLTADFSFTAEPLSK